MARLSKARPLPFFLTYGRDAVEVAALRCAELKHAREWAGLASWRKVLQTVRALSAAHPEDRSTIN
jgi:hypothetical protein